MNREPTIKLAFKELNYVPDTSIKSGSFQIVVKLLIQFLAPLFQIE